MKKTFNTKIFLITLIFLTSTFVSAQDYIFDFSINYVSLSMKDFNSHLESLKKAYYTDYFQILDSVNLESVYIPIGYEGYNVSDGVMVLLNFNRKMSKNIFLGLGWSYIFPLTNMKTIHSYISGSKNGSGYSVQFRVNSGIYLFTYMFNVGYTKEISKKFIFCSNISLGYGIGGLMYEFHKFESTKPSEYEKNLYTGFAPAGNINFSFDYKITDDLGLGINFGYRLANISEIKSTKTVRVAYDRFVNKGDNFKNLEGKNVSLDFSGATFGIIIKHRF